MVEVETAAIPGATCETRKTKRDDDVERVKGIEPSYAAWEAAVLPLNYTRDCAGDFTVIENPPQTPGLFGAAKDVYG
jgi:hypothetical protein